MELLKVVNFLLLVAEIGSVIEEGDFLVHEFFLELVFDEELVLESGELVLVEVLFELRLETLHFAFEFELLIF